MRPPTPPCPSPWGGGCLGPVLHGGGPAGPILRSVPPPSLLHHPLSWGGRGWASPRVPAAPRGTGTHRGPDGSPGWGGRAQHLCLLGKDTTGVSAPLPLGAGGARRRDSGLCVPSGSAVSPYVLFLARCWAGPKFGTKPTVCANGETEAGAGGSHGGSQLLQVASKPSAQLQDTSSGHWKRLGFGRWSRAPPGLRHPAPLARAVPALPRPGAPSRSCSQGPVPVPLAPIGADVLYLSEIKNSGGGMERQEAQESSLVVRDRGTELTCSGGFGANTARIVIR